MQIALACSGIGLVNRGYESSVLELHEALKDRLPVVLYRGGAGEQGVRCATISRNASLYSRWPFNQLSAYRRYAIENDIFAMGLTARLFKRPADIVFTPDHILARLMNQICGILPRHPEIIFSNGAPFENRFCAKFRFVHQKSFEHFKEEEAPRTKMFLIPNGFNATRLEQPVDFNVNHAREAFGLPANKTVVLCLSALNSEHKRVDWIIDELAGLRESCFLVACGEDCGQTSVLKKQAESLGVPCKFMKLSYSEVPALIWSSDLMVLGSLWEGFGRVVAEAMGAKKHIFVHHHENARWILDNNEKCLVDMSKRGNLAKAILQWRHSADSYGDSINRNYVKFLRNFTWAAVAGQYVEMFEKVFSIRRFTS